MRDALPIPDTWSRVVEEVSEPSTGRHRQDRLAELNGTQNPVRSLTLDDRELAIVHALIRAGSTAGAAKQVGLSDRHTRRLLAILEERLGVSNPFALVARAVGDGMIDLEVPHPEGGL